LTKLIKQMRKTAPHYKRRC